jgi:hypothetical protein
MGDLESGAIVLLEDGPVRVRRSPIGPPDTMARSS